MIDFQNKVKDFIRQEEQKKADVLTSGRAGVEEGISSGFKGDFYAMLGSLLSKTLTDGIPNLNEMKFNSQKGINQNYQGSRKALQEDFAGRGMGGSGAANVALAGLAGDRYSATLQNNLGYDQMDTSYKQNALSQLLGLNQFGGNQDLNANSQRLSLLGLNQGQYQFDQNLQFQKDNQPSDWASLLGSLLGVGGQVASAGFMTNWGNR